ncbi:MAG: hypothetical protein ACO3AY_03925 [Chitinophagaceae bacterium]
MKKLFVALVTLGITAGITTAQEIPNRPARPPHMQQRIQRNAGDPVLQQLNLSASQKEQLKKEQEKALEKVLTPEQKKKLKELRNEQERRKETAAQKRDANLKEKLGLTEGQLTKLKTLQKEFSEKMQIVRQDVTQTVQQQRDRTRELLSQQQKALKELLNTEQLEKYRKMMREKMRPPQRESMRPNGEI